MGALVHVAPRVRLMPQRFEYDRLSASEFVFRLGDLGISSLTFARLFGVRENTVSRWLEGEDIPYWVGPALTLLKLPGAMATVRRASAAMIRRDNLRPQAEYPFKGDC